MKLSLINTNYDEAISLISNGIIPLIVNKGELEIDESEYPFYIDMGEYYRYDFIFDEGVSKNEVNQILLNNENFYIDDMYEKEQTVIIKANNQVIDINTIVNALV
jgi:hypothetical protein